METNDQAILICPHCDKSTDAPLLVPFDANIKTFGPEGFNYAALVVFSHCKKVLGAIGTA